MIAASLAVSPKRQLSAGRWKAPEHPPLKEPWCALFRSLPLSSFVWWKHAWQNEDMLILWALCFYQAVYVIRVVLHEVLVPTVRTAKQDTPKLIWLGINSSKRSEQWSSGAVVIIIHTIPAGANYQNIWTCLNQYEPMTNDVAAGAEKTWPSETEAKGLAAFESSQLGREWLQLPLSGTPSHDICHQRSVVALQGPTSSWEHASQKLSRLKDLKAKRAQWHSS